MHTSTRPYYDAIVVGARCAGAATALLLARAGLHVLNIDRSAPGTDTLSTHAIMRAGVMQLNRWGLGAALESLEAPPITSSTFYYGAEAVEVSLKPKHGVAALYAPRRRDLDALLVRAARTAGAHVRHRVSLVGLLRAPDGRVLGARLRADDGTVHEVRSALVVGADGTSSKVARLVQAPLVRTTHHAGCTIYGYFESLGLQGYHWHFADGATAGAIPTNGNAACVFVGLTPADFYGHASRNLDQGFEQALARSAPDLWRRVRHARRVEPYRAFGGHGGFIRKSTGPGWALVGDASYFKDPGTAHGISDALRDAEILVRALLRDPTELRRYQSERDALCQPLLDVTDAIASFAWDYTELKAMHRKLSQEMNRETEHMAAWDEAGARPSTVSWHRPLAKRAGPDSPRNQNVAALEAAPSSVRT
ncbi:MAG TPA: FAD-dependent monooxygenase [Polyangiaceae bacterium]